MRVKRALFYMESLRLCSYSRGHGDVGENGITAHKQMRKKIHAQMRIFFQVESLLVLSSLLLVVLCLCPLKTPAVFNKQGSI